MELYEKTIFSDDNKRGIRFNNYEFSKINIELLQQDICIGNCIINEKLYNYTSEVFNLRAYSKFLNSFLETGFADLSFDDLKEVIKISCKKKKEELEYISFKIYDSKGVELRVKIDCFSIILIAFEKHGLIFNSNYTLDTSRKVFDITADSLFENNEVSAVDFVDDARITGTISLADPTDNIPLTPAFKFRDTVYRLLPECKNRLINIKRLKSINFFETGNLFNFSPEDEKRYNLLCTKAVTLNKISILPEIYVKENGDCVIMW